jgi:hypothetical protein
MFYYGIFICIICIVKNAAKIIQKNNYNNIHNLLGQLHIFISSNWKMLYKDFLIKYNKNYQEYK